MTTNNEAFSMSDDDIQAFLDRFMEANEEECQHMLNEQGHILLSDNAFKLIRDQITELRTLILPTLEKKLQLLEETKRLRAHTKKLDPQQNMLASPPKLKDLIGTPGAELLIQMPPESMMQLIQQLISSPQEVEHAIKDFQQAQGLSDDQSKQFMDELYTSTQSFKAVDQRLIAYLLQKVWDLPPEKREGLWRNHQPIEELIDVADIQAYIEQHTIDISSAMNMKPPQAVSGSAKTNALPALDNTSAPIEKQTQRDEPLLIASVADNLPPETASSKNERESQVQDQGTLIAFVLNDLQQVIQSGGAHMPSTSPDAFDSIDTTNNPTIKYIQLLYRLIFMYYHSEGGRRLENMTAFQATLDEMAKMDSAVLDPQIQHFNALLRLIPTSTAESGDISNQVIQKNAEHLSSLISDEEPSIKLFALSIRGARGVLSNKLEDNEQAIKDLNEVIGMYGTHKTGERARAYMLRGQAYAFLASRYKQQTIEQALADYEEALTFFTQETAPDEWAEIHLNRSSLHYLYRGGDPVQNCKNALADSQAALSVFSYEKVPFRWAAAHKSCGKAYAALFTGGRSDNVLKAREHYNQALTVFTATNAPSEWAEILIVRGSLTLKNIELSMGEQRELRPDFFNRSNFISGLTDVFQDVENVISDLTYVLKVITKQSDPYIWAWAHNERAFTRAILAQNDRQLHLRAVLEDYNAALEIFTFEEYPPDWAAIQIQLARVLLRYTAESHEQDSLCALNHIDAALTFYTREGSPLSYHTAQELRAIMCERLGRWEEARAALSEARRVQLGLMTTIESSRDSITMTESSNLFSLIAEFTRSEISLRYAQIALRLDPPDYEVAVIALEEERAQAMRRLATNFSQQEQSGPAYTLQTPKLTEISSCITDTNMALVYLAAGTNVPLAPLTNMDDHLFLGIEEGLALIITRKTEDIHIEHLRLPRLTNMALSFLLEPVFEPGAKHATTKKDPHIPIKLEHTITKLGEMGLNELAQALYDNDIHQVTFVPYSSLGLFPLHAAQVTLQNGATHYLGELFEVNIAPSAYAATQARQRALAAHTVAPELKAVFSAGNPKPTPDEFNDLLYAQEEAEYIHDIAARQGYMARYLKPREITKERVFQALQREKNSPTGYMYAHLAVHGIYRPEDPRNSRLILAGRNTPARERCILLGEVLDGTIDLSGIRLLNLSACQTSVIDIQQIPNEAVSLASAFLQAGVAGVIASLWKVNDWATYLLMTHFAQYYLGAHGTLSPARALILAQRWLREEATYQIIVNSNPLQLSASTAETTRRHLKDFQEKAKETPDGLPFAHPKYWAAFIVTGY